jgi:hypothetical protein
MAGALGGSAAPAWSLQGQPVCLPGQARLPSGWAMPPPSPPALQGLSTRGGPGSGRWRRHWAAARAGGRQQRQLAGADQGLGGAARGQGRHRRGVQVRGAGRALAAPALVQASGRGEQGVWAGGRAPRSHLQGAPLSLREGCTPSCAHAGRGLDGSARRTAANGQATGPEAPPPAHLWRGRWMRCAPRPTPPPACGCSSRTHRHHHQQQQQHRSPCGPPRVRRSNEALGRHLSREHLVHLLEVCHRDERLARLALEYMAQLDWAKSDDCSRAMSKAIAKVATSYKILPRAAAAAAGERLWGGLPAPGGAPARGRPGRAGPGCPASALAQRP